MKTSQPLFFVLLFSLSLVLCSCSEQTLQEPVSGETWFPMKLGEIEFQVKLALLPAERTRGLMFVKELGENQGMLFISPRPEHQTFWMRNTPLPLDIGFFDSEGSLLEIYPLAPYDETSVRSRSSQLKFALEMNQGWFRKHQLFPDSRPKLDLSLVRKAIEQRGLSKQYPL